MVFELFVLKELLREQKCRVKSFFHLNDAFNNSILLHDLKNSHQEIKYLQKKLMKNNFLD